MKEIKHTDIKTDKFIRQSQEVGRRTFSKGVDAMRVAGLLMLTYAEMIGPDAVNFIRTAFFLDWTPEQVEDEK